MTTFFKFTDASGNEVVSSADAIQFVIHFHAENRAAVHFKKMNPIAVTFDEASKIIEQRLSDTVRYFTVRGSEVYTDIHNIQALIRLPNKVTNKASCWVRHDDVPDHAITEGQYSVLAHALIAWFEPASPVNRAYDALKDAVDKRIDDFEERLLTLEEEIDGEESSDE